MKAAEWNLRHIRGQSKQLHEDEQQTIEELEVQVQLQADELSELNSQNAAGEVDRASEWRQSVLLSGLFSKR